MLRFTWLLYSMVSFAWLCKRGKTVWDSDRSRNQDLVSDCDSHEAWRLCASHFSTVESTSQDCCVLEIICGFYAGEEEDELHKF